MKLGLALAGGGVKGAAHVGVLKALEEENIQIEYIGGTSSGSIVASLYAMGFTADEIYKIFKKYCKKIKYVDFFNKLDVEKFKKIIFVSENAKDIFNQNYPELKYKTQTIYNLIDYNEIINKSKVQIEEKRSNIYTFLNVGRHTEKDKRLSRIIEAAKRLKKDNLQFRIIFVGDGKDSEKYKEEVKKNNLEKEIIFLGNKKNPYPYFKIADSLIMTSEYEGFPVVYMEALVLGLPIITTNVSDSKKIIDDKYGIVLEKNVDLIYNSMKKAIKEGIKVTKEFNYEKYNEKVENELENLIKKK